MQAKLNQRYDLRPRVPKNAQPSVPQKKVMIVDPRAE